MFSVYGRMTALSGRRDELINVLLDGFRAGGDGSGLLTYSINTVVDDPDAIWLTQLWIDKDAHDATTRSEPVAAVTRRLPQLLARQPEACTVTPSMFTARPRSPDRTLPALYRATAERGPRANLQNGAAVSGVPDKADTATTCLGV